MHEGELKKRINKLDSSDINYTGYEKALEVDFSPIEEILDEAKKELFNILYTPEKLGGTLKQLRQNLAEIVQIKESLGRPNSYAKEDLEFVDWVLKWFGSVETGEVKE